MIILSLLVLYILWFILSYLFVASLIVVYGPLAALIVFSAIVIVKGKEYFENRPKSFLTKTIIASAIMLTLGLFYTVYKFNYGTTVATLTGVMSMILPISIMFQAVRA
ncbi:hypothetical protein [Ezakiella coagulans]|uniref:hypothetical protein n=1 Tax=Ezakiella coagulans TaxID=46507 RepID=UPI0028899B4F|nr:hypothetical protein [Ezakiella coagulans]